MTLNAKLVLLVVALAVAADLAGAFVVLRAVPRPPALRSIRGCPVHLLFRPDVVRALGALPPCLCVGLARAQECSCSRLALYRVHSMMPKPKT
jgi:hypothetical protein